MTTDTPDASTASGCTPDAHAPSIRQQRRVLRGEYYIMLWTIVLILLILWLLGLVSGYALGGIIHILLVVAVVLVILNLARGRRVV